MIALYIGYDKKKLPLSASDVMTTKWTKMAMPSNDSVLERGQFAMPVSSVGLSDAVVTDPTNIASRAFSLLKLYTHTLSSNCT